MRRRQKMIWLFSFADLAFILVLALSIMPREQKDYSGLKLAQVPKSQTMKQPSSQQQTWRIHVTNSGDATTWPILLEERDEESQTWLPKKDVKDQEGFSEKLVKLKNQHTVPGFFVDSDSQSGDMLKALSLVQNVWPQSEVWTTVTHPSSK